MTTIKHNKRNLNTSALYKQSANRKHHKHNNTKQQTLQEQSNNKRITYTKVKTTHYRNKIKQQKHYMIKSSKQPTL